MKNRVVYKTYNQNQLSFLPPSYDDLVSKHHPVRVVNTIIDHKLSESFNLLKA